MRPSTPLLCHRIRAGHSARTSKFPIRPPARSLPPCPAPLPPCLLQPSRLCNSRTFQNVLGSRTEHGTPHPARRCPLGLRHPLPHLAVTSPSSGGGMRFWPPTTTAYKRHSSARIASSEKPARTSPVPRWAWLSLLCVPEGGGHTPCTRGPCVLGASSGSCPELLHGGECDSSLHHRGRPVGGAL